jgi:hypothetical protein
MNESLRLPWLDEETAVLLLTEETSITQGTRGFPALLHIDGDLTWLDSELSVYAQPTVSANGVLVFGINEARELLLWQDGAVTAVPVSGLQDGNNYLYGPALSPDNRQVVGRTNDPSEPYRSAYGLASLEQSLFRILYTYDPVGTDAVVPLGIRWSPNGQWVALTPSSWDVVEGGTWLVKVDGTGKIFLGPGSGSTIWLDADQVVFSDVRNGQHGLQLYNLATDERFWLDMPQFTASLHNGFWLDPEKWIRPRLFVAETE